MPENRKNPKKRESWRYGAGILLCTRDEQGRDFVVLGQKRETRKERRKESRTNPSRIAARFGFCLHGWSLPFGTMAAEDGGDHARCAIRETAEELLGLSEAAGHDACCTALAAVLGIPATELVGRLEPEAGWRTGCGFLTDHRVFLLRAPWDDRRRDQTFAGNWEFPRGLRWCLYRSPDAPDSLAGPWHWALRRTLEHFHDQITTGS